MKRILLFLASVVASGLLHAGDPAADLAALQALHTQKAPPDLKGAALFHWSAGHANRINDLAERFMADHPADPRRWEAALIMFARPRVFVKSTDDAKLDRQQPGTVMRGAVEYDREAQDRWRERLAALDAEMLAANDLTPEIRRKFELGRLTRNISAAGTRVTQHQPVDLAALRADMDRALHAYPDAIEPVMAFDRYVSLLRRTGADTAALHAFLGEYADTPHPGIRSIVETGLVLAKAQEHPLDWKFTAADGREVDLARLRGKVVLIDFWATWCKPCIAEIPHIKEAYEKYHAHGFEVVGITLETSGIQPGDGSPAAQARLAASKRKLLDFVEKNGLTWPHYFDGLGWRNAYVVKYGIRGIPAMFLLDQSGRVVTMDARGEKLEAEVKRLLKL